MDAQILSPQQIGIEFENTVHYTIQTYLKIDNLLREKDVKSKYGINNSCIDHMFDIPNTNIIICIQDKWTERKQPIETINHFMKCVQNIQIATNKQVHGIYLTKVPITKNSLAAFECDNKLFSNIYFNNIYLEPEKVLLFNSQELLIDNLLEYFHDKYNLWTFDLDNSIRMR